MFEIVNQTPIATRDDCCIGHYTNDPQHTPPEQLVTEISITKV